MNPSVLAFSTNAGIEAVGEDVAQPREGQEDLPDARGRYRIDTSPA
jgi:hypothetical protein